MAESGRKGGQRERKEKEGEKGGRKRKGRE
jgi:hypothetical protein